MASKTILITGITGFLGSHIAESLAPSNRVIGLIRNGSDLSRCKEIGHPSIVLVNSEDPGYEEEIHAARPDVFIHCAWGGVSAADREEWSIQVKNINYTLNLLQLVKAVGCTHFIALGSQAEYGSFEGRVDETYSCKPYSAYGAAKLATMQIAESFCNQNALTWHWLRIFPMYGTREAANWFIPSVIKTALENGTMDLTLGEQRYGYLHVTDFCKAIAILVEKNNNSGVYNLAANQSIQLKNVIEKIIHYTDTKGSFRFGALPYRKNQVMHMEGNAEKFYKTFHFLPSANFDEEIQKVINYYKSKIKISQAV